MYNSGSFLKAVQKEKIDFKQVQTLFDLTVNAKNKVIVKKPPMQIENTCYQHKINNLFKMLHQINSIIFSICVYILIVTWNVV